VGWSDRLQRWLLSIGWLVTAILLIRFAIDFSKEMQWWLALPFIALAGAAVWLAGTNAFSSYFFDRDTSRHTRLHLMLLAAIPLGFLASSLDCMGLSPWGCSPFCTFVKLVWIPLLALACFAYFFSGRSGLLSAILMMTLVPLVPHCVCYNVGNAWWIDRIGTSPLCYGWGFAVSMIALGGLRSAVNLRSSLFVCFIIIAGATTFSVSHHYFHFPW
jgi:hypothetical protein